MSKEDDFDGDDFDPTSEEYNNEGTGGGGKFKDLATAGTYLLGIRDCIEHGHTNNGKNYSKYAFVVLEGPEEGASFLDRIFRDPSAHKRLAVICKAARVTERFKPKVDSEMERVFVGRALKAEVEIEEGSNGKHYARLKWPLVEWTPDELADLRAWEKAFKKSESKTKRRGQSPEDQLAGANAFDKAPLDDFGDGDIPW